MSKGNRRFFPETFKREAVGRVRTCGLSIASVAAELGLHETVLRQRVRAHSGMQAPPPSPSELASENARLRRKRERLRMERDILKKLRSSSERPPD